MSNCYTEGEKREATFQEKYRETEIGIRWTCVEGLKWF